MESLEGLIDLAREKPWSIGKLLDRGGTEVVYSTPEAHMYQLGVIRGLLLTFGAGLISHADVSGILELCKATWVGDLKSRPADVFGKRSGRSGPSSSP